MNKIKKVSRIWVNKPELLFNKKFILDSNAYLPINRVYIKKNCSKSGNIGSGNIGTGEHRFGKHRYRETYSADPVAAHTYVYVQGEC